MVGTRHVQHQKGRGLEGRARARPLVMLVSALAILVVIGALWIGFAAKSERHPSEPQILQGSAPNVGSQTTAPAPAQHGAQP